MNSDQLRGLGPHFDFALDCAKQAPDGWTFKDLMDFQALLGFVVIQKAMQTHGLSLAQIIELASKDGRLN